MCLLDDLWLFLLNWIGHGSVLRFISGWEQNSLNSVIGISVFNIWIIDNSFKCTESFFIIEESISFIDNKASAALKIHLLSSGDWSLNLSMSGNTDHSILIFFNCKIRESNFSSFNQLFVNRENLIAKLSGVNNNKDLAFL